MPRTTEPIKRIESTTKDGKTRVRYVATADAPRGPDGKRRQIQRRFPRRKDAVSWLATMRAGTAEEIQEPEPEKPVVTFAVVAAGWLAGKAGVRPVTLVNYEAAARIWSEEFGDLPVEEITRAHVEELVSRYAEDGRSKARISYLLMVCRSVFEEALEEGYVVRNPARRVSTRGVDPKERHSISVEEIDKIRSEISGTWMEAAWLLTLAGLRRSELLGLLWSDVDLEAGILRIERARVQTGGSKEIHVGPPKTRNGRRDLPLPADVLEVLRRIRNLQAQTLGFGQVRTGYLVVDEVGRPIRPEAYSDEWDLLCSRAGIGHYTLHEARHTSVTRMRERGVPDMDVAAWHGHDEVTMRRTYSHPSEDGLRRAGETLFGANGTAL